MLKVITNTQHLKNYILNSGLIDEEIRTSLYSSPDFIFLTPEYFILYSGLLCHIVRILPFTINDKIGDVVYNARTTYQHFVITTLRKHWATAIAALAIDLCRVRVIGDIHWEIIRHKRGHLRH